MSSSIFKGLFVLFAIADLLVLSLEWPSRWATKPMIMISLIGLFIFKMHPVNTKIKWAILISLIFALLGDIFLLDNNWFILGLISFLGMQIGYCITFLQRRNFFGNREKVVGLFLLLIVSGNIYYLWGQVGNLKLPITIYALSIGTMALLAFTRDFTKPGYWAVFVGSIFFVISDMALSLNLFASAISLHGSVVMSTYVIAQYLIVTGMINYLISDTNQTLPAQPAEINA